MQFLKKNKNLFYIAFILPIFFFYFDSAFILWTRDFKQNNPDIYLLLGYIDYLFNIISDGLVFIIIACMFYIIGNFFHKRFYKDAGKSLIISFLSAGILAQILKHLIGRARPRLTDNLVFIGPTLESGYDSFPSGHTTIVFCFAYILSQYFPRYRAIFYIFAVISGFERAEDYAHFFSDVLAGAVIGLILGKMLFKVFYSKQLALMPEITPQSSHRSNNQ